MTVTVNATNLGTGTDVAGQVLVDGKNVGTTGTPFTHTFRTRRIRIPGTVPPEFEVSTRSGSCAPPASPTRPSTSASQTPDTAAQARLPNSRLIPASRARTSMRTLRISAHSR